jgi:hypothetical protein
LIAVASATPMTIAPTFEAIGLSSTGMVPSKR